MSEQTQIPAVQDQVTPDAPESQEDSGVELGAANAPEQLDSLQDTLNDPSASPKEKLIAKKMLREIEVKYNNQVSKEKLPFEIPDEPEAIEFMKNQMQLAKMGKLKGQEKTLLEKEVKDFFSNLVKNPRKVLADPSLGIDFKKMVQEYLEEEISNSQKSPEQIRSEKLEAELKSLKEEKETQAKEKQELRKQMLLQREAENYDQMIGKALEKTHLPKSEYVVKKIANYLMLAVENGMDASVEDVLPLVTSEIETDMKQMLGMMPGDVAERFIGKEFFDKRRKTNLAKVKSSPTPKQGVKAEVEAAPVKKQSLKEALGL